MSLNNLNYMNMMSGMNMYGMYNMNSFDMYGMGGCNSNPYINWNLFSGAYQLSSMGWGNMGWGNMGCGWGNSNNNIWGMIGLVGGSIFGGIATSWISDGISDRRDAKAAAKAKQEEASNDFYGALKTLKLQDKDILTLKVGDIPNFDNDRKLEQAVTDAEATLKVGGKKYDEWTTHISNLENQITALDAQIANTSDKEQITKLEEEKKTIKSQIEAAKNLQEQAKKNKTTYEDAQATYNEAKKIYNNAVAIVTENLATYREQALQEQLAEAAGDRKDRRGSKSFTVKNGSYNMKAGGVLDADDIRTLLSDYANAKTTNERDNIAMLLKNNLNGSNQPKTSAFVNDLSSQSIALLNKIINGKVQQMGV